MSATGSSVTRDPYAGLAVVSLGLGLAATVVVGLLSAGVYHEDDLTHFLVARRVGADARYLLYPWGRPGFTVPYALPAMLGSAAEAMKTCRLLSAIVSAATAWLAYLAARQLRIRHAWLAIPLIYLQPLFTRLASTTLTETPLALYFAGATWLLLRGRTTASAALIALAPLTREEAIVILPVWALALWQRGGRWWDYPLMLWALAAHNIAGYVWLDTMPMARWFKPQRGDAYGHGTPLTFVPRLIEAAGPTVVTLALLGVRRLRERPTGWVLIAAPAVYFLAETVIFMHGAFASGGYARFLVPIAPWLAILAAAGVGPIIGSAARPYQCRSLRRAALILVGLGVLCQIEWYWRPGVMPEKWQHLARHAHYGGAAAAVLLLWAALRLRVRRSALTPAWASIFIRLTLFAAAVPVCLALRPLSLEPHQLAARDFAQWIANLQWRDGRLISPNHWVRYWTDLPAAYPPTTDWPGALRRARPGDLFVWDARFCPEPPIEIELRELQLSLRWQQIWSAPYQNTRKVLLAVFQYTGNGPAASGAS